MPERVINGLDDSNGRRVWVLATGVRGKLQARMELWDYQAVSSLQVEAPTFLIHGEYLGGRRVDFSRDHTDGKRGTKDVLPEQQDAHHVDSGGGRPCRERVRTIEVVRDIHLGTVVLGNMKHNR